MTKNVPMRSSSVPRFLARDILEEGISTIGNSVYTLFELDKKPGTQCTSLMC